MDKSGDQLVVSGGDIPFRYFDMDCYDNTFKIRGPGLNFKDVYEHLKMIVRADDIKDICKVDADTFNISVTSKEAYDLLSNIGSIVVRDRSFKVVNITNQMVEFKVHWLPTYIKDSFLEDYFSQYGKVVSVTRENMIHSLNESKSSGIRRIMIETDEVHKRAIPYVIKFNGGYTALITMPGRPPMCLKCRNVGHMRRDCPGTTTRRTYASATAGNLNDTPNSILTSERVVNKGANNGASQSDVASQGAVVGVADISGGGEMTGNTIEDGSIDQAMEDSQVLIPCGQPERKDKRSHEDWVLDPVTGQLADPVTGQLVSADEVDDLFDYIIEGGKKVKVKR